MRTIAVFTGTRADYGLLRRLALAIDASVDARLALIVSGSHLSVEHGTTAGEIADDGLEFAATIPIWSGDDTAAGAARDVGAALPRYLETLEKLAPDVAVLLGDRLEAFAFATAAALAGVPIAHIHGGELTEGALDDGLRHAITKLAYLHFTSTAEHRRRVIQLGEQPDRVHFLGAPVVDALATLPLLSADEVSERFGVPLDRHTALVTFHPAAMDVLPPLAVLEEMLEGLIAVDGLGIVVTGTNSDIGSMQVRDRIAAWVRANSDRVTYVESFGQLGYLSAMASVSVVVGNSSSVVLEAPVLGTPSVLVGARQKGRPVAASVWVPRVDREEIASAIRKAISTERDTEGTHLFGEPGFADRALNVLLSAELSHPPVKAFYNLESGER